MDDFDLILAPPSACAEVMKQGQADIGLVPVAALNELEDIRIITDFCIGAKGAVASVLLISQKPLHEIRTIALDDDSRTSVELIRVLARNFWKIDPKIVQNTPENQAYIDATLAIGDKCFTLDRSNRMVIDLAEEWYRFTGLPIVFACWVAKKSIRPSVEKLFDQAIRYGIGHKLLSIEMIRETLPQGLDAENYLSRNISFELDEEKRKGLGLFLTYLRGI